MIRRAYAVTGSEYVTGGGPTGRLLGLGLLNWPSAAGDVALLRKRMADMQARVKPKQGQTK